MNLHQFRFVQEAVRRNLNLTETAKTLGMPEGTLKARLSRGRALLTKRYANKTKRPDLQVG